MLVINMNKFWLLTAFAAGYLIMSLELLGSRLLAPYFGNSIYVWGSLIGLILAALAAGYYLGGRWADKENGERMIFYIFSAVALFLLADVFLYKTALENLSAWGIIWGSLAAVALLFLFPMVALAAVAPLAVKLLSRNDKVGQSAGLVYALGTIGSLAGVFLTVFWLIPYYGSRLTLYGCFLISLLVLAGLLFFNDRRRTWWVFLLFLISLPVWRSPILPQNVILETESLYNQIRLINKDEKILLTLNSRGDSLAQSGFAGAGGNWAYLDNLFGVGPLIKPVNDLLVLGLSAGASLSQHQAFSPGIKIDAVEIDPKIIAIAKNNFDLQESGGLKIVRADARPFLAQSRRQYDMIEIDLFQGSPYIPFYAATQEFFKLTAEHLTQDGFIMMNVFAPDKRELLEPILNTAASVYPSVYKIPLRNNFIILATRSATSLETIKERLEESGPKVVAALKPAAEYAAEYTEEYRFNEKAPVFTDDWAPVERITYQMLKNYKIN